MEEKISPTKTLGLVSARFIIELQKRGKTIITLDDASNVYGRGRRATNRFLCDLVKRGILARIKSGVYLILQVGQESTQLRNWPIIAREITGPYDYFISHYSALRLHGMTTHSLIDVYITMPKRHRTKRFHQMTYHFVYSKPENFWGYTSHWVNKYDKVNVSEIERTLLDGLARPELTGGIMERSD